VLPINPMEEEEMHTRFRFTLTAWVAVAILLAGCAPAAATPEIAREVVAEVVEVTAAPAEAPSPLPAATASPAALDAGPGPSTGGTNEPNDQPYGDMFFEDYGVNPFIDTEDDHFSTFAVDVDTGSYTCMRRYVNDGYPPPDDSVRVEHQGAFAIHLEGAPSLYGDERYYLVRVGLKGYEVPVEERGDVVLTFVIDVSGSMSYENRLELVKKALRLLVEQLRPTDEIGIAVYGSNGRALLEHTPVAEADYIMHAIDRLQPEGATNAEEGLLIGYRMASQAFNPEAINRVILCSDGVANVGHTGPDSIMEQIREHAREGIYLTTVGFGMGNYNDVLMEQLADSGDGFYAYVDSIEEAERVFVHDLTSTLQVIARDAKVQVDFNPEVVSRYRLLGYENRDVADEDFRDDEVDAGEIGPGHSVTALYEIKFHQEAAESGRTMTVYVRYEDPETGEVTEINRAIARADFAPSFKEASIRFQLAAVVAEYAEILRNSYWARGSSLEDVAWQARRLAEYLPHDPDVIEFASLTERAASMSE
jgi:Ca-activated chloride channel family protein